MVENLAKDSGFIKRKSTLNGMGFLELLMFNSQQGNLSSLNELAEDFEMQTGRAISKQGLDERFNSRSVNFLSQVLCRSLTSKFQYLIEPNDTPFSGCYIRDSTRFGLPEEYSSTYKGQGGATKTKSMISIQYELDLLSGKQVDLQLTSGCRNDQRDSRESCPHIKQNSLLIRDLGYITSYYMQQVIEKGAYFLNRLPANMQVFDCSNNLEKVDFEQLEKKIKRYKLPYIELDVLVGKKAQIPTRIIVHTAEEKTARAQLKRTTKGMKSIGCQVSKEQKVRSRLNIYITNVDRERIKAKHVRAIYKLRWQIELVFKSWKSFCNIDKIKKVKIHRFECMLIAGLIWILANWKVFQCINGWFQMHLPQKTASVLKFFKYASKKDQVLRRIIFNDEHVEPWLEKLIDMAESKFFRESKKGKQPYLKLSNLLNPSLA